MVRFFPALTPQAWMAQCMAIGAQSFSPAPSSRMVGCPKAKSSTSHLPLRDVLPTLYGQRQHEHTAYA